MQQAQNDGLRSTGCRMIFAPTCDKDAKKGETITLWDRYKAFSPDFLAQHYDCLLYDAFHWIKALLLYPLACGCKTLCRCEGLRDKIVLFLNTDLHTKVKERQESSDTLYAMRLLLKIPEDSFFKGHYGQAYPV